MNNDNNIWTLYVHINLINNKKYIGIAKGNPKLRWGAKGQGYLHKNNSGYYAQPAFANAILKYGWENFSHEVLRENLTRDEACILEQKYIALLNTTDPNYGYNITKGGGGAIGYHHTEEAKQKISRAARLYKCSEETKSRISNSKKGHEVSIETREKISKTLKGCYAGENHPNYGKKHSQDSIRKMSESHMNLNMGENNGRSIPVYCVELNQTYFAGCEAARALKINHKYISAAIIGVKQKTAGGYH